jgi:hypothetical protein
VGGDEAVGDGSGVLGGAPTAANGSRRVRIISTAYADFCRNASANGVIFSGCNASR